MRIDVFGFRIQIGRRPAESQGVRVGSPLPRPDREASETFWSSFCGGGTLVAQCGCGRTVFASNSDFDWEEGELEDLRAKAAADPGHYIDDARSDSVSVLDMPDGLIVWGCPCHKAARYEQFLIGYRLPILEYYAKQGVREEKKLTEGREALAKALGQGPEDAKEYE